MCSDCVECFLEGGNGPCEVQDFKVDIECQAEYKPKSDKEEKLNEK